LQESAGGPVQGLQVADDEPATQISLDVQVSRSIQAGSAMAVHTPDWQLLPWVRLWGMASQSVVLQR
jgi:hypothetical protein